mgnify:FL=1
MQLHVRVLEAAKIPNMDVVGKSDPYTVLTITGSNQKWKTTVKDNTNMPIWNEVFTLPVSSDLEGVLKAHVWDKDLSSDDEIGEIEIPIKSLVQGKILDKWYNLKPAKGMKDAGQLRLVLHLDQIGFPAFVEH